MARRSLFSPRTAVASVSLAALTLLGPVMSARAESQVTDGWQHSMIGRHVETLNESVTDGWQHSQVADVLEPPDPATDGWITSVDVLAEQDHSPIATTTDGWFGSIVGEQARNFEGQVHVAEATPSGSSIGHVDELAVASGVLNLILMSAGLAFLLRQRHRATVA